MWILDETSDSGLVGVVKLVQLVITRVANHLAWACFGEPSEVLQMHICGSLPIRMSQVARPNLAT